MSNAHSSHSVGSARPHCGHLECDVSTVTLHHATLSHMVYLANQNQPGERHLQKGQDAANQSKLRLGSTYDIGDVTLGIKSLSC